MTFYVGCGIELYNVKDKASMTRHEIMLILERYDVDPKTYNVIADKILALSGGVGQSEQFICGAERVHGEERCDKQCVICLEEYGTSK